MTLVYFTICTPKINLKLLGPVFRLSYLNKYIFRGSTVNSCRIKYIYFPQQKTAFLVSDWLLTIIYQ